MATLVDRLGIICLAIGSKQPFYGRTRLQKMIYFARYLGWDIHKYKLHFYGPYSNGIANSLDLAITSGIINEIDTPPTGQYTYTISDRGTEFTEKFVTEVCDRDKTDKTRTLFASLVGHSSAQLELAATIDFVKNNTPSLKKGQLLDKVGGIKENFPPEDIRDAYNKWIAIKRSLPN